MIPVTQPYLPDRAVLDRYLDGLYESRWLTNNGPLVQELESRLCDYLGVPRILLVANGTLALQIAFRLLNLSGEAVTTPFTFAATSSALRWQGIQPHYADIDSKDFNIDPASLEQRITDETSAIVPVHVYGNPCRTEAIRDIAQRHQLPVVYDAAHAFGVQQAGESVLNAGDISTLSFHATKLFHTVEGGALIINDPALHERAKRLINFGFDEEGAIADIGINAKMSELHAAMGLATLDSIDSIIGQRAALVHEYRHSLEGFVEFQQHHGSQNGAYMPILLASSEQKDAIDARLRAAGVIARRYFSPALHEADVFAAQDAEVCATASDISQRVLCLPLYSELALEEVRSISEQVVSGLNG